MGRLVISENLSVDGVVQDPSGDEGFERGSWVGRIGSSGRGEAAEILLDEARDADALLLGRRTYEFFAARWPSRTGELADRLNTVPKFVVSSTLKDPLWGNSTVLARDVTSEVSELKERLNGDIVIYGSFQLVNTLLDHDLVNEVRLMMYPVVLGTGSRLFDGTSAEKPMRLLHVQAVGEEIVRVAYEIVADS
jgi:dihydrofolate reductase